MTAEAESNGNASIVSDDDIPLFEREDVPAGDFDFFDAPSGMNDIVDGEVIEGPFGNSSRLKSDGSSSLDRDAKSGQPNIDEWMHFFSKVCIRVATDFYIDYAFREVDEDELSDNEIQRIKLTDIERDRMARPFAEYSNKSKFMKKHGRMIIASADSIDAVLQMGMWFARVNRIASKYKGTRKRAPRVRPVRASPIFQPTPQPQPEFEDRSEDVSSGQSSPSRTDHWRPDIRGPVYNPGGGG